MTSAGCAATFNAAALRWDCFLFGIIQSDHFTFYASIKLISMSIR